MTIRTQQSPSSMGDTRLAATLAAEAGARLMALRARVDAGTITDSADELRHAADASSQAYLATELARERPGDAVLSEEDDDDLRRLLADRVWIIDPLDGSREFAERTPDGSWRTDFAVHVALWRRGRGLTDAAVALPGRGLLRTTATPSRPEQAPALDVLAGRRPLRIAVSRTRPAAIVDSLAERGDVEVVPMGSAGVKAIAVVEGTVDAYVHADGLHEWDSAAPVAVATTAGMVTTRLDGSGLVYNQADPWLPDLVICHPALVACLRAMLEAAGHRSGQGAHR